MLKTDFKATTIVAGTNNNKMLFKMFCRKTIVPSTLDPKADTITRIVPAIKKGVTSFSDMFSNPTTKPKITSVHGNQVPYARKANITARIIPTKKAQAPNLPVQSLQTFFAIDSSPPFT